MKNRRRVGKAEGVAIKKNNKVPFFEFSASVSQLKLPRITFFACSSNRKPGAAGFNLEIGKKSPQRDSWSSILRGSFQSESCRVSLPLPFPHRWVREFLNEDNKGLDVLVEYLSFAQYAVT